jgi:glutamyl-tRNA synthetase
MAELPASAKIDLVLPFVERAGYKAYRATVMKIVEAAGPRLRVAGDILDYTDFFTADDQLPYDEKALDKHVRKEPGAGWIGELRQIVATAEPFDADTLKARVEEFIQARGVKPIPVTQTLRVATTGKEVGFGIYETLAILGRARCLARIDRALTLGVGEP